MSDLYKAKLERDIETLRAARNVAKERSNVRINEQIARRQKEGLEEEAEYEARVNTFLKWKEKFIAKCKEKSEQSAHRLAEESHNSEKKQAVFDQEEGDMLAELEALQAQIDGNTTHAEHGAPKMNLVAPLAIRRASVPPVESVPEDFQNNKRNRWTPQRSAAPKRFLPHPFLEVKKNLTAGLSITQAKKNMLRFPKRENELGNHIEDNLGGLCGKGQFF